MAWASVGTCRQHQQNGSRFRHLAETPEGQSVNCGVLVAKLIFGTISKHENEKIRPTTSSRRGGLLSEGEFALDTGNVDSKRLSWLLNSCLTNGAVQFQRRSASGSCSVLPFEEGGICFLSPSWKLIESDRDRIIANLSVGESKKEKRRKGHFAVCSSGCPHMGQGMENCYLPQFSIPSHILIA